MRPTGIHPSIFLSTYTCYLALATCVLFQIRPLPVDTANRLKGNRHPVRSAKDMFQIGLRVVRWVITGEHKLLCVFALHFSLVCSDLVEWMGAGDELWQSTQLFAALTVWSLLMRETMHVKSDTSL